MPILGIIGIIVGAYVAITYIVPVIGSIVVKVAQAIFDIVKAVLDVVFSVINPILDALWTTVRGLFDFVSTWLSGIAQYFGGELVRAVTQVLILGAAGWVWDVARQVPVLGDLLNATLKLAADIRTGINSVLDQVLTWVETLRREARLSAAHLVETMGTLGAALRSDVLRIVDTLFGGLESRLGRLRFGLLHQFDFVGTALGATVLFMGHRFRVVPEEVRHYLLTYTARQADQLFTDLHFAIAGAGQTAGPGGGIDVAPWRIHDDALRELELVRGGDRSDVTAVLDEALADLATLRADQAPAVEDLPPVPDPQGAPTPAPDIPSPDIPLPPPFDVPA